MNENLWDVPQTEEGLQLLLTRLADRRAAGDEVQVGWGLMALAHLVKWVRSDNHEAPFMRAGTLANEALEIFRRVNDKRGILAALCAPRVFMPPDVTSKLLAEAEAVAQELGDEREVALVLAARGRNLALSDRPKAVEVTLRALEAFVRLGDEEEQARCLFGLAVYDRSDDEKRDYAIRGAYLFRNVGNLKMASKCISVALMNVADADLAAYEPLVRQGLEDVQACGYQSGEGSFYGKLAKIELTKGNLEEAAKYQRWQQDLSESDGMTPRERNREAQQMTKLLIAMAKASGNTEGVVMFKAELNRLKKDPNRK